MAGQAPQFLAAVHQFSSPGVPPAGDVGDQRFHFLGGQLGRAGFQSPGGPGRGHQPGQFPTRSIDCPQDELGVIGSQFLAGQGFFEQSRPVLASQEGGDDASGVALRRGLGQDCRQQGRRAAGVHRDQRGQRLEAGCGRWELTGQFGQLSATGIATQG